MNPPPAIACEHVTVRRGPITAVDDLSVTIPQGSITGLLGPSGCGKTTLMRSIVGTQRNVEGVIEVLGHPAGSATLRRHVGYVTQSASVYTDLTVEQNVRYFATLFDAEDKIDEALAAVDLTSYAPHPTSDLSGGQVNRVSIACALVTSPTLLILDEPTVGLDPVLRADLWARFAGLAESGVTLLVSSHVMDEAAHCDNLILMRDGRLVSQLTPIELRSRTGQSNLEDAFLTLIEESAA
ncbi:putative ABC transporter ATP-binding protein [Gordonia effusa NBRC 100432]|uniref:Putative ABC transporter ATP-binding protein n=1 Tax=Gordonia effusa NBRC 100432 TaxID=1077974 RepID=H0QWC4_9ACTN|nr:ABC transporter ATP-binding protein [Gordonia effusa]GAB17125.1 putative ABC transporter ATP-binding protein [Gordonia effusa NBRC 100432]